MSSPHSQSMNPTGHLVCEWCGARYDQRSPSGRIPRFCKASHRVRACERRRGLLRPRQPPPRTELPAPTQQSHAVGLVVNTRLRHIVDRFADPIGHETGRTSSTSLRTVANAGFHRARSGGLPDRHGRVPSLCGAMIRILGLPTGVFRRQNSCKTCERLADLHPTTNFWWKAATQRAATALADDLRSTVLVTGQAIALKRDPIATLSRVDEVLRTFLIQMGIPDPLQPSLHPMSTAS
jgi:hypothetical protein